MKNTKRKGFTIVELVIVIAVIAILAAVLIPTFASLVKKANVSADEQAVKQMNTALAIYTAENGKPETVAQVKTALDKNLINAEGLVPVTQGYAFYWSKTDNKIVLINDGNKEKLSSGEWALLSTTGYGTSTTVSTLNALKSAIDASSSASPALITLANDLTLSKDDTDEANGATIEYALNVKEGQYVVLDLNQKTMTLNEKLLVSGGGSLDIKNGDISTSERAVQNMSGSLTMKGIKIRCEKTGGGAVVFIDGISNTSIVDCTIETSYGHAIGTNSSSETSDGARISIVDSNITTTRQTAAAINITIGSNVVIDGCTVKGGQHGAYLRGCNATIKNTKFEHVKEKSEGWGSGNSGQSADLVLASGGTQASGFSKYYKVGNYVCENVTASTVIVHQPDGGTVNVSGIENYHECTKASGEICTGND